MLRSHTFLDGYYVFITFSQPSNTLSTYFGSSKAIPFIFDKLFHSDQPIVVYYRIFSNHIDALGHKLLLQTLSKETLWRIINVDNPEHINLHIELIDSL